MRLRTEKQAAVRGNRHDGPTLVHGDAPRARGHRRLVPAACLAILLAIVSAGPAQAAGTWSWRNPLPQGNDLTDTSCPSTSTCYAVGLTGTAMKAQNGGKSWTVLHPNIPG